MIVLFLILQVYVSVQAITPKAFKFLLQAHQESRVPASDENLKPIKSYKIIYESIIKIMKTSLDVRSVGKHAKQTKQL